MIPRILIKHVAGSQANRIDQFELDGTHELIIGREPPANVVFDGRRDDTVSRRHALIKIQRGNRLRFTVADLDSTNGVRVNGKDIAGEQDLVPGDIVELSPGGPAFSIAVESEPVCLDGHEQPAKAPGPGVELPRSRGRDSRPPAAANKNIDAGWKRGRGVIYVIVLAAIGSGLLALSFEPDWWKARRLPSSVTNTVAIDIPSPRTPPAIPVPPEDPVKILGKSTVYLGARWRLYDTFSGKPVFQKVVTRRGQRLPSFVDLGDGRIVPWLTTEDEERTNIPIGGSSFGSGFVVTDTGGVITDRHIAAGWMVAYRGGAAWTGQGAVFRVQRDPAREAPSAIIELNGADGAVAGVAAWIPGNGGFLFRTRYPVQLGAAQSSLEGRNELLTVQFPLSHVAAPARLVRASLDADVAELKIDSDRPLPAVDLAADADLKVGDHVTVLGYSAPPDSGGGADLRKAHGLDLVTADGTIAGLGDGSGIDLSGLPADGSLQGGPVLAADGKVVAVVAPGPTDANGSAHAYSARLVRALLELQ